MYIDISPSLIPNTIMKKRVDENGEITCFIIEPEKGFKLHTTNYDEPIYDPVTLKETGEVEKGYTKGVTVVGYNYSFTENPLEIYAIGE